MGYFNYFIKCIIRNIAYRLCKPKVLFTVLLAVAILFGLKHFGYCAEWTTSDISTVKTELSSIHTLLERQIDWLEFIEDDTVAIRNQLNTIKTSIDSLNTNVSNINTSVNSILSQINLLNTSINNIYNKLDSNQQELLNEMEQNNNILVDKIDELMKALSSGEKVITQYTSAINGYILYPTKFSSFPAGNILVFDIGEDYQNYNFTFSFSYSNTSSGPFPTTIGCSNVLYTNSNISNNLTFDNNGTVYYDHYPIENRIVTLTGSNTRYIYVTSFNNAQVTMKDYTLKLYTTNSFAGLNNSISQTNQLQQEQNQLQQEQNDFLKDDNVDTEGFEFATDDTNNPTEEGFNTLFTSIYNAFCNTSSAPLTVTLPYINETLTIQPNLVSNAMNKMRFRGCGNFDSVFLLLWCLFVYI